MTSPQGERQLVSIRFADLRRLATSVPLYLAEKVGVKATPTLSTGIEEGVAISDLGTASLLLEFSTDYRVELAEVEFTGLISAEPSVAEDLLFFPTVLLVLGCWLGKALVALLIWPFSSLQATKIWGLPVRSFWFPVAKRPLQEMLTVGDFVASAALGRFVRREQVRFVVAGSNPANHHWATA